MQVWWPEASKDNTQEAGAGVKRKVVHFQVPASWKMGDSCHKGHLHITAEEEIFIWRERGKRANRSREVFENFSACR